MSHTPRFIPALALLAALLPAAPAPAQDFSAHWHDGKAELDGYTLQVSRYGETREGRAVLIYVTEPFSTTRFVKVDDPSKRPEEVADVLKLNLVRDFQTGIYDYNTMVSVFSHSSDFSPLKISFSSAEWCGHVYEELRFGRNAVEGDFFSYFEGESARLKLDLPAEGIAEDNLFILLRGLRGDFLAPGEQRSFPFLPSTFHSRLAHRPMAWDRVTIERETAAQTVTVPAGTFVTMVYRLALGDGRQGTFHVEQAWPHRIVKWELLPDVSAELTGTLRVPYWSLNGNGEERYLKELGLAD